MRPTRPLAAAVAAVSLLVACGDDDAADDASDDTTTTETTAGSGPASVDYDLSAIQVAGEVGEAATITVDGAADATELVVSDLVEGDGDEVPAGATVTIHYSGVLTDGTEFDASFGGPPATFPLAGLIAGWQEGIPGMREGGRRLLVIPPELGYGAQGGGPIPPNATLIFVVDLLEVAA